MIGAYIPDLINLMGALISVVGFLYVTYDLLKRERLQLLTRLLAPALIGGVILVPFGALDYILFAPTYPVIQGVILFGLVGVMIGLFNGSFVRWAPQENKSALKGFLEWVQKWRWVSRGIVELSDRRNRYLKKKHAKEINKPTPPNLKKKRAEDINKLPFFSVGDALIGLIIAFPIWLAVDFLFDLPFVQGFGFVISLAVVGGIFAGFWRFINWEPSSPTGKPPSLSWAGGVIGFVAALASGWLFFSHSTTPGLAGIVVFFLALSGGMVGVLWRYSKLLQHCVDRFRNLFKKTSVPADTPLVDPVDTTAANKSSTSATDISFTTIPDKPSTTSTAKLSLDGKLALRYAHLGKHKGQFLAHLKRYVPFSKLSLSSSKGMPTEPYTILSYVDLGSKPKPPFFSGKGCLIGLISAFCLGVVSALLINLFIGKTFINNVSGALTGASVIWLAGAATGGVSRYIFDWANHLEEGQLLLIGGFITLLGFALQVLPPLLHLLGISGQ